ncbi:MAG: 2-C-methyl-D-erythritol 4-phosphate cytidylyltransferase [Gemmataceae bacterium]
MPSVAVIMPAAGRSSRFGGREKKPFTSLDGRPVWQRSAELFWNRDDVSKVYIVISPEDREEFRTRFQHLLLFANAEIVDGGAERFDSVANALARVPESVEFVSVHDAVRPLATAGLVDAVFQEAFRSGAAMLAVPVADTLKRVEARIITGTVSRENVWQAQTPQVFRREWLAEAYAKRTSAVTDDAQLIEALGHRVAVVPGSPFNFKITTQDDLQLAEAILKQRIKKADDRPALGFSEEAQW